MCFVYKNRHCFSTFFFLSSPPPLSKGDSWHFRTNGIRDLERRGCEQQELSDTLKSTKTFSPSHANHPCCRPSSEDGSYVGEEGIITGASFTSAFGWNSAAGIVCSGASGIEPQEVPGLMEPRYDCLSLEPFIMLSGNSTE